MKKALLIFIVFFLFIQANLFANPYIAHMTKAELTGRYKDPIPPEPPDKSAPDSEEENYNKTVPYRLWEVNVEWEGIGSWLEWDLILYCNGSYQSNVHYHSYSWYYDWEFLRDHYTAYYRYYDWVQGGITYTYTCEHGGTSSVSVSP